MATRNEKKPGSRTAGPEQLALEKVRVGMANKLIKSLTGGVIGIGLTGLFSVVILAFIAKAFLASEETARQLLNSAITIAGTTLGAVLGYFFGKNAGSKSDE